MDLPNAIDALQNDTEDKIEIIELWQMEQELGLFIRIIHLLFFCFFVCFVFRFNIYNNWCAFSTITEMEDYYNRKLAECQTDMNMNNEMAESLMDTIREYHISQMYPSILDLADMASEMRDILTNIVNGAELSAYAGEVDEMVQRIEELVADAKRTLNTLCMFCLSSISQFNSENILLFVFFVVVLFL